MLGRMSTTFEIPTLHTERLTLRAFRPADIDAWSEMEADPEVRRYRGNNPRSRNEAWTAMETSLGQWALRGYGLFALERKSDGRFIGIAGVLQPADWPEPELSYSLAQHAWGGGLAMEAAAAARDWGFAQHRFPRLASFILPDNTRSQRVAQKLGAVREGMVPLRGLQAEWWVHRPAMTTGLLAPDEASPVRVLHEFGVSPLFLTADHAGRAIPRALGRLGLLDSELERHIGWDIGIAGVTERLSAALDATAVLQHYSRLVIDCNRDPTVPSSMPEISETTEIPGNAALSDADRAARRQAIFEPYHARIRALLDARQATGQRTIYVAMHSFTPVFKGESRAMQVGVLYNRDARLANIMLELLRAEGDLTIGDNAPYAVSDVTDYGVPVHAERRGLAHVEIEIRQDLIADVAGQAAWAARFTRLFTAAVARL